MATPLTPRQARFVEEYLIDLNATQAAIRAGYAEDSASVEGSRLLANAKVAGAVTAARAAQSERTKITADKVLQELARIGFSDAWHYQSDEDGRLCLCDDAPSDATRAVSSVKEKIRWIPNGEEAPIKERTVEFKLWDKNTALTNLAKHLGLLTEKIEVTGKVVLIRDVAELEAAGDG